MSWNERCVDDENGHNNDVQVELQAGVNELVLVDGQLYRRFNQELVQLSRTMFTNNLWADHL